MGKTRDFFRKIGGMKGIFHARMGRIKDKNSKDLTEAEEIKKRWQELVQKNGINDLDNHKGVVTHLESGILECEVKRALGSIVQTKLVKVMEFELSNLKPLKIMLLKCCTQYASKFEKLSSGHILEKVTFHSSTKERQCQRMFKLLHNCTHLTC